MKPALSCNNCRARKKKCDRIFPICSYCLQTSHRCVYRRAQIIVSKDPSKFDAAAETTLQDGWLISARYLDLEKFNNGPHVQQQDVVSAYPEMLNMIKDVTRLRQYLEDYLETVDVWMSLIPFTNIRRMMQEPLGLQADQTLLLACIQLVMMTLREDDPVTKEYLILKMVFVRWEAAGTITLQITQARFLLLLYEFGHGLCQAAYISLGACMRYLTMTKIEDEHDMSDVAQDWLVEEQYRRLWWMGFIFDRVLNLGLLQEPSAVLDPEKTRILPCDEASWRQESRTNGSDPTLASPPTANMGHFRLLVLAANLLGLALEHAHDLQMQKIVIPGRTEQLYRTMLSFLTVLEIEGLSQVSIGVSRSIINSAIFVIYTTSTLYDSDDTSSMTETSPMGHAAYQFLTRAREYSSGQLPTNNEAAPFLLHWGYNAYLFYYRKFHVHHREEDRKAINDLAAGMRDLNQRWKIASVYLNMLSSMQAVDGSQPFV